MSKKVQAFAAEVKELLDLMIHSLYSHKEVFLRELVSNSSDALDKIKFESFKEGEDSLIRSELEIRLVPDKDKKTLTVIDNGIGMTHDEVVKNLGTIAYSGTRDFLKNKNASLKGHGPVVGKSGDTGASEASQSRQLDMIGQFGVGFYSAFMVADRVILHTQKWGESTGVLWESEGTGEYSIEDLPRPQGHGTTVTLYLKKLAVKDPQPLSTQNSEEDFSAEDMSGADFTDEWVLRSTVKKYSDFISYPIKMLVQREEYERDENGVALMDKKKLVETDEVLNTQKAIWLRSSKDVSEQEYKDFYHHVSHDWKDPLHTVHYKAEGTQEFSALLYFPTAKPWDFEFRDTQYGLSLYVRRVLIKGRCEELLPRYLRFVSGVVDSHDISLNVSREMLQKNHQVLGIQRALTSKVLSVLKELLVSKRDVYENFWKEFSASVKEGAVTDHSNKEKLKNLLLFHSSHSDQLTTLQEYVDRMGSEQSFIYFLNADSLVRAKNSPYLEKVLQKGYEVLYLVEPVDEWVVGAIGELSGKKLMSISSAELSLGNESEKQASEFQLQETQEKLKPVIDRMLSVLDDHIKEIKISDRLVDSPVCLVTDSGGHSAQMEKMLESMGQKVEKSKRILEINPDHPIFKNMSELSDENFRQWAEILYDQALLCEGSKLDNPQKFVQQVAMVMAHVGQQKAGREAQI